MLIPKLVLDVGNRMMMKRSIKHKWGRFVIALLFYSAFISGSVMQVSAQSLPLKYDINYFKLTQKARATFTNINQLPEDSGYLGAKLAVDDSNSTGKFINQTFSLRYAQFEHANGLLAGLNERYLDGQTIFLLQAPADLLIAANTWAKDKAVLLFNISEPADGLRYKQCLSSMLHTIPSYAMKSDALAQWLVARRLQKVLMIRGKSDEDKQVANAFKRSVKRFGLKVVDEKIWDFSTDLRRTTQQEIPLFTQTSSEYDVVYVADPAKDFAEFLPFNTYLPRPVIGSAGLEALAWHRVIEQWGAAQLQSRFVQLASRNMNELDFSGYLALRTVAQAAQHLKSNQPQILTDYIHSSQFELAAYKGRKLSYRQWNGQLRMPMALVQPNALVSQSPQEGMLHPENELDTLGYDAPEMKCQ